MKDERQVLTALGNFYVAAEMFRINGYRFASAEEVARARIEQGSNAEIACTTGWTREGMIYIPKTRELYITKRSPILSNTARAWRNHSWGEEVTSFNLEEALADSVRVKDMTIPVDKFGEDETMVFLLGRNAKRYGEFLGCRYDRNGIQKNIKEIRFEDFEVVEDKQKAVARQIEFNNMHHREIISAYRCLHSGGDVVSGEDGTSIGGIASFGIKE
jgi:hypothetical protein